MLHDLRDLVEFHLHALVIICAPYNFREHSIQIAGYRLEETGLIAMTTWSIIDLISCRPPQPPFATANAAVC